MTRFLTALCALLALSAAQLHAGMVKQLTAIEGQGESIVQGLGLVMGLPGTGDSGSALYLARPLAEVLRNNGNPVPSYDELASTQSVALVMVTCVIPASGARANEKLDVTISAVGNAASLTGGELYLTPLTGPFPGSPIFAVAQGSLTTGDPATPTKGRVRLGARMVQDVRMAPLGVTFNLMIKPEYAGWSAATQIAASINDTYFNSPTTVGTPIAVATDDRTVRITVPPAERAAPAPFVASVMSTSVNTDLLRLPARIVVNTATGIISVTGDVRLGPVAISHRNLRITTTTPPPIPTPDNPIVDDSRWASLGTDLRTNQQARLEDLLAALEQLDVPVADQVEILHTLRKSGQLQAEIVID